ncbi:Mg-protoporphyrin IX monomethyl ester oxidative cyclase [Bdellovibrio bacteriovorus]|uniref:Mg-protoporphyrin IX monomethyl ester oxidative cyclase n=1 Tax=Bdellovibrio bacteriovorus TaxID=959 RepID=A0A162GQ34_BDEBC|nr:radical SAM protein [Bdellovibrio bacteriovorus]KYG68679.1 Mg-protoporphyrin IX monomethyl ester oxidative cyclase [Bdellovibrio bacteriovorus]
MNKDILLVTLNSSYPHSSFGLRYLMANLGDLQDRAQIMEFTIQKDPRDIAEALLRQNAKIIGLGVYIWNAQESLELVSLLKRISPDTIVVLGGPEVSHESESQKICQIADFTIKGEADFLFYEFCKNALDNGILPETKFISGALPDIKKIKSPYELYTDEDIQNRVIYVEVSRGCPYRCEYCLSSLDKAVRSFELTDFLSEMQKLLDRGARQFKFIDRTFNLSPTTCTTILQFFLDRIDLGLFLHFEMVPDRLPLEIRDLIKKFPPGALQFEIGIQTWNPEVARLVSRRNDYEKVKDNFRFLAEETGVHTHADLIAGLPGEDLESFAKGFDILASLRPHEIQVGILKRLKGAPIARHDKEWQMVYADHPPFQILRTKSMNFDTLQVMNRFAKYWDLYANSGSFKNFVNVLREKAQAREDKSFFWQFFEFNTFLTQRYAQSFGISQLSLFESAYVYLKDELQWPAEEAKALIMEDYSLTGKTDLPKFLKENVLKKTGTKEATSAIPKRQQRHLAGKTETVS